MLHKNLRLIEHPILAHKLGILRDKKTHSHDFRNIITEMSRLLAYEATRNFPTVDDVVETPMAKANVKKMVEQPVIVSIMRAGNVMLDGILSMLPFASAGHIGIYRDKFIKNTVEYYFKLPEKVEGKTILLADPLLATGDTAIACIDRLKQYEVGPIKMLCVLVSGYGLEKIYHFHPDVEIFTVSLEEGLNDQGYLLPGLGDAGDRLYQTK